jgi:hypothetical protein
MTAATIAARPVLRVDERLSNGSNLPGTQLPLACKLSGPGEARRRGEIKEISRVVYGRTSWRTATNSVSRGVGCE